MRPRTCAAIRYGGGRQLGVGSGPRCRLPGDGRLGCFHGSTDVGSTLFLFFSVFFLIPQSSEGLHSVSSRDNGVPSVTTVRITEHNGGRAAVMPAQGRPTGSSCSRLSSDGSRVFQATCDLLPAATSACFAHVAPRREQKFFQWEQLTSQQPISDQLRLFKCSRIVFLHT